MKWFFSNKAGGFFPEDTLAYCESVGTLPNDLKEVTEDEHTLFTGANPNGKLPSYNTKLKEMEWKNVPNEIK